MIPLKATLLSYESSAFIPFEVPILLGVYIIGMLCIVASVFYLIHRNSKPTHTNQWANQFYEGLKEVDK